MGLLRFILAITVVMAHSSAIVGFTFVGGQIAVQAFFIISGFYMSLILNEKYIGVNQSYKLFLSNRLLRLYPIYWVVLVLTMAFSLGIYFYTGGHDLACFTLYSDYIAEMNWGSLFFLIFTNLMLFLQDIVMFLGLDPSSGSLFFTQHFLQTTPQLYKFLFIPQAWSIGIELAFYLVAPFIVKRKLWIVITLILLSILIRSVLYYYFKLNDDPWTYRFLPTEFLFFLLGILSYRIYKKFQFAPIKTPYMMGLWVILIGFTLSFSHLPLPLLDYLYFIVLFLSIPFVFNLTKNWSLDRYMGDLSYPIYISHMFVLVVLNNIPSLRFDGSGLLLSIWTVICSILLNELVAKKIERYRQLRIALNANVSLG